MVSAKALLIAGGALVVLQIPVSAWAVDEFPFYITAPAASGYYVKCNGPYYRYSGCVPIGPGAEIRREFYRAEDTFFGAIGRWSCDIRADRQCNTRILAEANFCGPGGRKGPNYVELNWDGGSSLTVNHARACGATSTASVLGQNGEDDKTPARDQDTFNYDGKVGEKVEIKLDRDGSSGSAGSVVTLSVRSFPSSLVVAQRTGEVPLTLKATLPGPVELVVARKGASGDEFRGYYSLEVTPDSGDVGDRKLKPQSDVEQ